MNIYEMKITNNIRQDRSRGKKIWDNINKLRGKITDKDKKVVLYTAENEHILNTHKLNMKFSDTGQKYTENTRMK